MSKKSNAEALGHQLVEYIVAVALSDEEINEEHKRTIVGMIEEAWGAEEAQKPPSGHIDILEACKLMCPSCRKGIQMHDGRSHLTARDTAGPGHHSLTACTATALRRLLS